MNRRRLLVGIALGALLLVLSVSSFSGGFGFFNAPAFETEITLPVATPPVVKPVEPTKPTPKPAAKPCNGKPGNPVIYYANNPLASQYDHFGTPVDPRLNPLDEPYNPQPDVQQVITASWDRLCHDPVLTRATVAAAFPSWEGLHRPFNWTAALDKLISLDWKKAQMVYHTKAPTSWTMMMKHGETAGTPPTVYITRAHHAGWYLSIPIGRSHTLLLRSGCGNQPSLDLREGYAHAALSKVFATS